MSSHRLPSDHETNDENDEIDVRQYVRTVWRYRLAIAIVTVVSSVLTYWVASRETRMYAAVTRVAIDGLPTTASFNPEMSRYKALLDNRALAARIVREFGLDKPPYRLTGKTFLDRTLSVVEVAPGTNMVDIRITLPDPVLAAKVANRYTELSRELAEGLGQDQRVSSTKVLKAQVEQAKQRLADADDALQHFKQQTQIELAKQDVDSLLGQRGRLMTLIVDTEAERARLAEAERAIGTQDRVLKGQFARDLGDALRQVDGPTTSGAAPPFPLRTDAIGSLINPVYYTLEQQITASRTKLAGLERERAQLVGTLKLSSPQLAGLTQLYAKQSELARLDAQADLFRKIYSDVARAYAQANLLAATPAASVVQIVDPATPPDGSITPGPLRKTEIGLGVSLLLSMFGAVLYDVIARPRQLPSESSGKTDEPARV